MKKVFTTILLLLTLTTSAVADTGWTMAGVMAPVFEQGRRLRGRAQGSVADGELIAVNDLHRVGAFKSPTPDAPFGVDNWVYNVNSSMSHDPVTDTLYVNAGNSSYYINAIDIPTLSSSLSYAALPAASYVQGTRPAVEGRIEDLTVDDCNLENPKGVLFVDDELLISGTCYYGPTAFSHFTRSADLSVTTLNAGGPSAVIDPDAPLDSSVASGPMALIPDEWQASFGGNNIISGLGPVSVIGRSSVGPAISVWKSSDLLAGTPSVRSNVAQGGTGTTIILDTGASAVDDAYNNHLVVATIGLFTQHRFITDYVGSTRTATLATGWNALDPPISSTPYEIWDTVPSKTLVRYTGEVGEYAAIPCIEDSVYCTGDSMAGLVWIPDTRTIAVFGTHSPNPYGFCYGPGGHYGYGTHAVVDPESLDPYERYAPTYNPVTGVQVGFTIADGDLDNAFEDGKWAHTGNNRCYDPVAVSKGEHNYPYLAWVWLYDAEDLLKIYNGEINPGTMDVWQPGEIVPYEHGELPDLETDYPCDVASNCIYHVGLDTLRNRIYIAGGFFWTLHAFEW